MKTSLFILIAAISSQTFAAEKLITLTRGSGFSPVPRSIELSIEDNGKIISKTTTRGTSSSLLLGTLSKTAVANLKDRIELIDDNAVATNLDANRPRCMDAPSTRVVVNKGGKEIRISAKVSCQRFEVEGTSDLTSLITGLETLSK